MFKNTVPLLILSVTALCFAGVTQVAAQFGFDEPTKAPETAVTDVESIQPGVPFFAGVRLDIAPGWHTYWKNVGNDVGIPTSIEWDLPEGFVAGELLFSTPHYEVTQEFPSHVFTGTVYHVAKITPPANLVPGTTVAFGATLKLLVCDELSCEPPNDRTPKFSLPVSAEAPKPSAHAAGINKMLDDSVLRIPNWRATASLDGDNVIIEATIPEGVKVSANGLYLFPNDRDLVADGKKAQSFEVADNLLRITIPKAGDGFKDSLSGLLVSDEGFGNQGSHSVSITAGESAPATVVTQLSPAPAPEKVRGLSIDDLTENDKEEIREANKEIASWFKAAPQAVGDSNTETKKKRPLAMIVFLAFIGGIILNLMPCVFPVLGIKIMGFVNQAGEDKATIRKHGLVFAVGVIVSLWALVAILLALKHFGSLAGWGFQLQDPTFLAIMILIVFAFGLNLAGLFEIGTSLTAAGSGLQQKHGYSGSFFSGILAVLVATPCTGPFMGPAIAFAFAGTAAQMFIIFTALGLGLALPYVLLSWFPYLIQKLPKPGAWMETFKQFMAFPLIGMVIWLIGVFGTITGIGGVSYLLFGLLTLAFGLWIYGRFGTPYKPKKVKISARLATVAIGACAIGLVYTGLQMKAVSKDLGSEEEIHGIVWTHWDPRKIVEARNNGRTIFIDFTADW